MAFCTNRIPLHLAFHLKAIDGGYNLEQLEKEVKEVDTQGSIVRSNTGFSLTVFGRSHQLLVGHVLVIEQGVGRLMTLEAFDARYEVIEATNKSAVEVETAGTGKRKGK